MNDTNAVLCILSGTLLQHDEYKTDYFLLDLIFQTTAKPYSGTIFLCYASNSVD